MELLAFQKNLDAAKADPGIQSLAVFAALCITYADEARREIGQRVTAKEQRPDPVGPGPLLGTATEAAALLGPSFTARKLYRITPDLPNGCAVRKGGRLYFVLPKLKKWAAQL